ncbi:hypothetical protein [Sinanaerobacter sp. ZZT-01]|uniref:hypothetical protein n=1 Tax=Sinanaerobacter sp. ZZT-01 TaxID=3111540 RepID=UPI002D7A2F50|nr:hypothetical protein [Sinanaerobacter sp. ZZT-01]WRR93390.1 hypothetical protein U5921_15375 [Sinanaerobacter sp. ZZT-01]
MKVKKIKALVKRKEFIFTIMAYPFLLLFTIIIAKQDIWPKTHPEYYSAIMLLICSFIILCFSLEILIKIFTYRVQGDKLKLRQREGINILEIKEINHGH